MVGHTSVCYSAEEPGDPAVHGRMQTHSKRMGKHGHESQQGKFPPDLWRTFFSMRALQLRDRVREVVGCQPSEIFNACLDRC